MNDRCFCVFNNVKVKTLARKAPFSQNLDYKTRGFWPQHHINFFLYYISCRQASQAELFSSCILLLTGSFSRPYTDPNISILSGTKGLLTPASSSQELSVNNSGKKDMLDHMICDAIRTAVTDKTGKAKYRLPYSDIRACGYRSLVSRYYRRLSRREDPLPENSDSISYT